MPSNGSGDKVKMNDTLEKKTYALPWRDGHVTWHEFGASNCAAPPLVLLHGGHGSWEHWLHNIPALAGRFHLLVPDMPGYGASSVFDSGLQSGILEPLLGSLDALVGPRQVLNIAGFSFGGFVAAHLAAQRAGVHKLALLGSAGHGGPRRPRGELLAWRDLYAQQDWIGLSAVMRENLYQQMLSSYARIDALAMRIHQDACVATRFKSKPLARSGGLAEQLESYPGPALFIWGEHDVTCTPEYLKEKLVDGNAGRFAEIVQDAGHWVQYEKTFEVNQLLMDWFK